jgi:3-hydroxyisobutyrate dehydrogenase-like beta-hydroxyacid dehydrogenase
LPSGLSDLLEECMTATTIGLINPGAMGASVGAAAGTSGARVIWAGDRRSADTRARAERAELIDCGTTAKLADEADIILSVCPPHAAEDVAVEIAERGFRGIYVEGNAIAPPRTRSIASRITAAGSTFVDGGIIGGPAWHADAGTRFYLSGPSAPEIARLFSGSPLEAVVISDEIGAASALKMCFAAYTKGSTALLSAILGLADHQGVRADLERQWGDAFTTKTHAQVAANTAKAWRFAGEMREIAATFASAAMPDGFHLAAAEIFERLSGFKDQDAPPAIDQVLEALRRSE